MLQDRIAHRGGQSSWGGGSGGSSRGGLGLGLGARENLSLPPRMPPRTRQALPPTMEGIRQMLVRAGNRSAIEKDHRRLQFGAYVKPLSFGEPTQGRAIKAEWGGGRCVISFFLALQFLKGFLSDASPHGDTSKATLIICQCWDGQAGWQAGEKVLCQGPWVDCRHRCLPAKLLRFPKRPFSKSQGSSSFFW